jgi:hypothetical protein
LKFGKRTLLIFLLGNVTALVITACLAGYYYVQYQNYKALTEQYESSIERYKAVTMHVNFCIDYGNGTIFWYNETVVPLGYELLNATRLIAEVNSTYWPAYQASFVDAINGVANNPPYYWMWLYWDENENMWKYGPVGADLYSLKPNEVIMWRYEKPAYP